MHFLLGNSSRCTKHGTNSRAGGERGGITRTSTTSVMLSPLEKGGAHFELPVNSYELDLDHTNPGSGSQSRRDSVDGGGGMVRALKERRLSDLANLKRKMLGGGAPSGGGEAKRQNSAADNNGIHTDIYLKVPSTK